MHKSLFFVLALGVCLALASCSEPEPPPRSSRPSSSPSSSERNVHPSQQSSRDGGAAIFRLPRADGQVATVKTPTALFFFTTWCGYCKQAMPEINRLADRARARGWTVYGIDVREGPQQVQGFIQQYQPNFPVLLDQEGLVAKQYNIRGYPTFIVIDRDAKIIYNGHEVPKKF